MNKMSDLGLGEVVITKSVSDLLDESLDKNGDFFIFINRCLNRYMKTDWGDLTESDRKMNDQAVLSGAGRILSAYNFPLDASWVATNMYGIEEDKIWIITEWDHSVTTILFPGEY